VTRLVGINHVALEVGDVEEALAFYSRIFELELRGRAAGAAFVDLGDQFIALMTGGPTEPDRIRHFGLVVDDKPATRRALEAAGVEILPGRGLDFRDPWGNLVQVVQYDEVQFTKTERVLRGMGLEVGKTDAALAELRAKGLACRSWPLLEQPAVPLDVLDPVLPAVRRLLGLGQDARARRLCVREMGVEVVDLDPDAVDDPWDVLPGTPFGVGRYALTALVTWGRLEARTEDPWMIQPSDAGGGPARSVPG
jgi:predicted enzyme related to lactoylglutathione lyase